MIINDEVICDDQEETWIDVDEKLEFFGDKLQFSA